MNAMRAAHGQLALPMARADLQLAPELPRRAFPGFTGLSFSEALHQQALMNHPDCDGGGWVIQRCLDGSWMVDR